MSEVIELRQYTLHPGQRDTLIELFERAFIEPQDAAGMRVLGSFRDLGDPDRFVWFRSFPDMVRRKEALTAFYDGPVWKANRDAANATMIDSDDVLLLRLVEPFSFPVTGERPASRYFLTVYSFDAPVDRESIDKVLRVVTPLTLLQTEPAENTYPRLPVRDGENVIVALTVEETANDALAKYVTQRLMLEPTARSLLR
jgi:NIPSNAP